MSRLPNAAIDAMIDHEQRLAMQDRYDTLYAAAAKLARPNRARVRAMLDSARANTIQTCEVEHASFDYIGIFRATLVHLLSCEPSYYNNRHVVAWFANRDIRA